MRYPAFAIGIVLFLGAVLAWAQETPKTTVATYDELANAILAIKRTEANFVRSVLNGHRQVAAAHCKAGDQERAAAEIALFGNEGDNAVGGIRKRLLEGGHHHNAEGEAKGIFDPGYVIVTRKVKQRCLAASAAMRQAQNDTERQKAWQEFDAAAAELLGKR